ncbi:peroxiredoxin family protein [Kribbella sp. NPDC051620]|uniref:peroxiredoxin family protein n=1 Tax=Kribbella sp. NPDC051620 TaxID=3364120 RepID=UPI0037ADF595
MPVLKPGDPFPELPINPVGSEVLRLPDALHGSYGVVLIYRGSWCPYCNAQLSAFGRAVEQLEAVGGKVIALSVDGEETTKALIDKHRLPFPVGYGADAREVAARTGAFLHEDPLFLESTGFVLSPQGRVLTSVYSSATIGRLVPADLIGFIRYIREHAS